MKRSTIAMIGLAAAVLLVWYLRTRTARIADTRAQSAPAEVGPASRPSEPDAPVAVSQREAPMAGLEARGDDLAVRVVDPAGNPVAEIPLVLMPAASSGEERILARATSDAGGRARLEGVAHVVERAREACVLRAEVPFDIPPEIAVTRAAVQQEELVFALPWGGGLEIVASDPDGGPLAEGTEAEIAAVLAADATTRRWSAGLREGHAFYPWVQLKRTWGVFVWSGPRAAAILARGEGPRAPRATARIEVTGAPQPSGTTLRAVDRNGAFLAHVPLELRLECPGRSRVASAETDDEGRFVAGLVQDLHRPGTLIVRAQVGLEDVRVGRVGMEELRPDAEVVLAPEAVLAEGRVLDGTGRPIPDATVEAALRLPLPGERAAFGADSLTLSARSDPDGRFELRGLLAAPEFELRARRSSVISRTARVSEGARAIELVLAPPCTVGGRVLVSEVTPDAIDIVLLDGERELGTTRPSPVDGTFAFQGLAPGVVRLRFALHGEELATFDAIPIPANAELGAIDLRGLVHRCAISLVGAAGGEEPVGVLVWRACGSDAAWQRESFRGRKIDLVTTEACLDLQVWPDAYRGVRASGVTTALECDLCAALLVRLVVETEGELPAYPDELVPELVLDGQSVATPRGAAGFSGETREVVLRVGTPGRLEVRWRLDRHAAERHESGDTRYASAGRTSVYVLADAAAEVEVVERAGEQVIPLRLSASALRSIAAPGQR